MNKIAYRHVSVSVAPGRDPDDHDWGIHFFNDANDPHDAHLYLLGFPSAWHCWEFILTHTGMDYTAGRPAWTRQYIYNIPPEDELTEKQLQLL